MAKSDEFGIFGTDGGSSRPSGSKRKPPPNYFSRKEQYRLLILCAMLMLVLVMMNEARKPQNWKWLWAGQAPVEVVTDEPIDTKLDATRPTLPDDGFTLSSSSGPNEGDLGNAGPGEDSEFMPGVTAELLASIKDNTVLRAAENEAWLTMLRILNETSDVELQSRSIGEVSFSQLFRQTDVYRGRLVTVKGTVRRLEEIQPRENDFGITELYRWIVEPEGGANSPIVVYSVDKPAAFPDQDDLREDATFNGFCFKRWAYSAGDGTRIAPLLLAKSASWQPPPPVKPVRLPSIPIVVAALAGLVLLAMAIARTVYRSSVAQTPEIARLRSESVEVERFNKEDVLPNVGDALSGLADTHDRGES